MEWAKELQDNFEIEENVGNGSYSNVFKANTLRDIPSMGLQVSQVVAIKKLLLEKFSYKSDFKTFENEISLMQKLSHPNIIKLYGVIKGESYCYLIIEYCNGGDLNHYITNNKKPFSEKEIQNFIIQIGSALQYLSENSIAHRDLKPHNILLTCDAGVMQFKIADFGFARFLQTTANTYCGSPSYMAPEIILGTSYNAAIDMWSLGIIIYQLITLNVPFQTATNENDIKSILIRNKISYIAIPSGYSVSNELRNLVSGLLTVSPNSRLTISQLANHPFLQGRLVISASKELIYSKRKQKFSFLDSNKDKTVSEIMKIVSDNIQAVHFISLLFTDAQIQYGDGLLLELMIFLSRFLMELVNEIYSKHKELIKDSLFREIACKIATMIEEANSIKNGDLSDKKTSPKQFLWMKAVEFIKKGILAEGNGEFNFAFFFYQKALYLLSPIIYLSKTDDNIMKIKNVYSQVLVRIHKFNHYVC